MKTIAVLYPTLVDVGCFSHTIDPVRKHFHTTTLDEFGTLWISLLLTVQKSKMQWKEQNWIVHAKLQPH